MPAHKKREAEKRANRNAYMREYNARNKERVQETRVRERSRRKMDVLTHYGGTPPQCACCGENHVEFLTIDHIDGDGAEHRRAIGRGSGLATYRWLRNNGYPKGFRVLCWNCNAALHMFGKCPHGTEGS